MNVLVDAFWNSKQKRLRAGWRILIHIVATLCAVFALTIISELFLVAIGVDAESTNLFEIVLIFAQTFGILISGYLCFSLFDRRLVSELRLQKGFVRELGTGFAMGALLMITIFVFAYAFGFLSVDRVGASSALALVMILANQAAWLAAMVAVGVSEEFFSRGMQLKNLAEGMRTLGTAASVIVAILLSSAFFGLLHWFNPHSTVYSTISITAAGIMLAVARVVSGRLALPIGIHAAWNFFQGPVFGFPVSGQTTEGSIFSVTDAGPIWLTGGEFGPEAGIIGFVAIGFGVGLVLIWHARSAQAQVSLAIQLTRLVRCRRVVQIRRTETLIVSEPSCDHSQIDDP